MKRKVKINKLPKGYMQQGGSVNKTLQPVPREEANLEAEKGEVAMLRQGGEPMTYNIGGKRHSQGGTPLNLEPGSRIFSDTKKMKIKDKNILAQFGATKPATPAKLAKKYNVNDYQASLSNPFADDIEKNTARMMINKNEEKLDDLFFVQEAKKGFPQGVPGQQMNQEGLPMAQYGVSSIGYIPSAKRVNAETVGVNAGENEYLINLRNGEEPMTEAEFAAASQGSGPVFGPPAPPTPSRPPSTFTPGFTPPSLSLSPSNKGLGESMFGDPTANFPQAPQLPFDTAPYQVTPPVSTETSPGASGGSGSSSGRGSQSRDPRMYGNIEAYEGSRANTPTGESNRFDYGNQFFDKWSAVIPGITSMTNKEAQEATYQYILENNPDQIRDMWTAFGNTKAGRSIPELEAMFPDGIIDGANLTDEQLQQLQQAYVDGYFGARQMLPEEKPTDDSSQTVEKKDDDSSIETYKQEDAKPFEQDLRNERVLGRNRMSERLRLPWRGRLAARTMDPVYQSDVQQQQNILAGLNTASDAVSTFGANPGAVMSNIARMSGISGNQSNQIAAALQKENTGIANNAEQFNAQQQTATDVRNMANAQDLYDNTIKAQEVFDEKMRQYNLMQTAAKNATDTNLARINTMNKLNPDFNINVGEGPQYGDLSFISDVARARQQGLLDQKTQGEQALAAYQAEIEAINKMQGLTEEHRSGLLKQAMERYQGYSAPKKGATNNAQDLMQLYNQMMPMVDPRTYYGMNRPQRRDPYNVYGQGYYKRGGKKY